MLYLASQLFLWILLAALFGLGVGYLIWGYAPDAPSDEELDDLRELAASWRRRHGRMALKYKKANLELDRLREASSCSSAARPRRREAA